jgi:putative tryptophan/tyrosine transport system substrate-binding protein
MNRRAFLTAISGCLLASPLAAEAQARALRIGYLTSGGCPTEANNPLFLEGLKERGYVVGQNLVIECRHTDEASDERFRQLAAELVRLNVALIFAVSSAAVRGVRPTSRTIPVVALDLESDPIASGLATSLARPGGNITGVFLDAPEMNGKRLEMLRELLPRLSRVSALWDASLDPEQLKATETIARSFGVRFQVLSVRGPKEFAGAFQTARRGRSEAVLSMEGPFMNVNAKQITDLALQNKLPSIGIFPTFVKAGGLMSYGPNVEHLFKQATSYIDRILKGAKPDDLPIERPTRFYTAVNLKTAKALGLAIPPSLLLRADEVIQ